MKFRGVRVDVQKAHELKKKLSTEEENLIQEIKKGNRHRNSNMGSKKHCRSISKTFFTL
jgi:DNA polymerase I-like protein with 3'-5' exonuclease and polymerase domains